MADNTPVDVSEPRAEHISPISSRRRTESDSDRTLDVEHTLPTIEHKPETDTPPDGGYGWVCVACNFFINGHTWGINSSYGVFLSYYLSHNYFPNTSSLAYAFIGGLSISQAMLMAPFATWVVHTFGTRVCLHLGVFFETVSLIGASFCQERYQIILAQGVCFGWGMGFLFVGSVGIIPQWFTTKRSLANAIAAAGSGLGGLVYSLAAQSMIDHLGLPWAFRILGIITFTVNLTAANLLRDRNTQVGARHNSFDTSILKRPEFLLLQGWSWFSMLGYVILIFSLAAYSRAIGLSAQQGSLISALFNLGQMLGRPFIGLASDRYGRINLATLFSALCGVFCFVFWTPASSVPSPMGLMSFFAIIGGALAGTFWCTIAPVGAEVVGLRDLPAALSLTWVLMVPPTTCAEPIALELRRQGWARDWIYLPAQIFTASVYVAGAICLCVVRGWKVGEMEEMERRLARAGENERSGVAADSVGQKEIGRAPELVRARSPSIANAGWNGRDLVRRMVVWKKV